MQHNRQRSSKVRQPTLDIPLKANKVLNVILAAFILIVLRVWYLGVIQHDAKLEEARRPQRRVVLEPAKRATIRDRFNLPLAINKIQYNAAVLYSQIRQIPSISWKSAPDGTRIKRFKRKEYIAELSRLLANILDLDAERVEDLIYSKAALYSTLPFTLKENISEKEYYRLKMLEKDWLGILVQRVPSRHYPQGRVAADVIGYMGAINRQEYEAIIQEIASLEEYVKAREEGEIVELPPGITEAGGIRGRLRDLQEYAYSINDYVGKTGIEARFEQQLRGFHGRRSYYSDARGNFLRELPGSKDPLAGDRLLLTLSAELQEYAEKLLTQNETIRQPRFTLVGEVNEMLTNLKQPWIKGGAIVAMEPFTGEVIALASYPRFDPNDFIPSGHPEVNRSKQSNIRRWFENEGYLAAVWDQRRPLEKELYDSTTEKFYEEQLPMTWDVYLSFILPVDNAAYLQLVKYNRLSHVIEVQKLMETLFAISGQNNAYALMNTLYQETGHMPYKQKMPAIAKADLEENLKAHSAHVAGLKRKLDKYLAGIPHNYDKVLYVDLCRLVAGADLFSDTLIGFMGTQTPAFYHDVSASMGQVKEGAKNLARDLFRTLQFHEWRKANEKNYLKEKRAEEKAARRYAKPYIDYFDAEEKKQFEVFWEANRWTLLETLLTGRIDSSIDESLVPYAIRFKSRHEIFKQGTPADLSWEVAYRKLTDAIAPLPSEMVIPYIQTLRSFSDLNRPLLGSYRFLRKEGKIQLEKHLAAGFYPPYGYGYGRSQAYRQAACQGSIFKMVLAYEALVQHYNAVGSGSKSNLNPLEMVDTVFKQGKETFVGYTAEGKPIPRFYKGGRLPRSLSSRLGKMDLLRAIETSSNPYFALLAGDVLKSPEDLVEAAKLFSFGMLTGIDLPAEIPGKIPQDLSKNRTGLYSTAIGQHTLVVTPLQTSVMLSALANGGRVLKPKIISLKAGRKSSVDADEVVRRREFVYQDSLSLVGIDFPFFTAVAQRENKHTVQKMPTVVKRELFMPAEIRKTLLEGMRRVVVKSYADSLTGLSKIYRKQPQAISDYIALKEELLGKSSTAEAIENLGLDLKVGAPMVNHVWFGGIAFDKTPSTNKKTFLFRDTEGVPELVVVVYLRYGGYGKEAAPVAAQIVKKWRAIKAEREKKQPSSRVK